ncbi:hypothetical protein EVAR_48503_1 [Eumeta japonica]|uniref:Uncharacterized protein n=1 Tax=Eumeta variegata TaxID=151549 RepID=A0A4C1XGV9_EUMVA|nr:hypothetical protein EVAR_48503_1 [Eumeta japonica]
MIFRVPYPKDVKRTLLLTLRYPSIRLSVCLSARELYLRNRDSTRHALTEYEPKVAASAVAFRLFSESSGGLIPSHPFYQPDSIRYLISFQEAGNALVSPLHLVMKLHIVTLWFNKFKRGRDHLFDDLREGRPTTAAAETNIDGVRRLLDTDKKLL